MSRALFVSALVLVGAALSFVTFAFVFPIDEIWPFAPRVSQAQLVDLADDLSACQNSSAGSERCDDQARRLRRALGNMTPNLNNFRQKTPFKAYFVGSHLIFTKSNCRPADVDIDAFAWNAWPQNQRALSQDREKLGFFGGVLSFKEKGYIVDQHCLLLASLPTPDVKHLEAGQFISSSSQFAWAADYSPIVGR